ncbi:MAG: RNA 2',3'-cyclic phosphodiesterase [Bacteroidales bacterium]|nr:RNA 2',3'-cyclic phosphodiesterase [Bacteroidales bacterium]
MKRLFLAIKLIPDDNLLKIYHLLQQSLYYDKIRWVDPVNFHLTLKFFGNTSEEKIPIISDVVQKTLKSYGILNMELKDCGVFGSKYKPRVIWFGVTENNQLKNLGIRLLNDLNDAGFLKDRQNFVPHITVGRITKIIDKRLFNEEMSKVKDKFLQQIVIDKIILFESVLSSGAPQYNVIKSFPLNR